MNLTELAAKYHNQTKQVMSKVRPASARVRTHQSIAYFENTAASVEALIAQGPLPTGQVWHLEGKEREISGTAWGTKAAKTAAK